MFNVVFGVENIKPEGGEGREREREPEKKTMCEIFEGGVGRDAVKHIVARLSKINCFESLFWVCERASLMWKLWFPIRRSPSPAKIDFLWANFFRTFLPRQMNDTLRFSRSKVPQLNSISLNSRALSKKLRPRAALCTTHTMSWENNSVLIKFEWMEANICHHDRAVTPKITMRAICRAATDTLEPIRVELSEAKTIQLHQDSAVFVARFLLGNKI